jgi:hypothetical protein
VKESPKGKLEWINWIGGEPLVELKDGEIFLLTEAGGSESLGHMNGRQVLTQDGSQRRSFLGGVNTWTATKNDFYVFGQVQYSAGEWSGGFLRVPKDSSLPASFLSDEYDLDDPLFDYYLLGLGIFASDGSSAYLLVMEEAPYVLAIQRDEVTKRIPVDSSCGGRPQILPMTKGEEVAVYGSLANADGPIGLYSQREHLFLLCRCSKGEGIGYYLVQLDPDSGATLGTRRIASKAAHLTVVPGSEYWAFVEKGSVESVANGTTAVAPIQSILFHPANDIMGTAIGADVPVIKKSPFSLRKFAGMLWRERAWIFSGLGVSLIGWLLGLVKSRRRARTAAAAPFEES